MGRKGRKLSEQAKDAIVTGTTVGGAIIGGNAGLAAGGVPGATVGAVVGGGCGYVAGTVIVEGIEIVEDPVGKLGGAAMGWGGGCSGFRF